MKRIGDQKLDKKVYEKRKIDLEKAKKESLEELENIKEKEREKRDKEEEGSERRK